MAATTSRAAQHHLLSFPTFSLRRPTTSILSTIIFSPTRFLLSSTSHSSPATCFPTLSVPLPTTASLQPVVPRGVISPSSFFTRKFTASAALNTSSSSIVPPHWFRGDSILKYRSLYHYDYSGDEDEENCSKRHWLVWMDTFGLGFETEQALFNFYIKTLATVLGNEEEAKKKIYFVSCDYIFGFGAEIDEETADRFYDEPGVCSVYDNYLYEARKKYAPVQQSDTIARFTPLNWNHRLDDIYSYHHLSSTYNSVLLNNEKEKPEWNSDHWLVHIKQPDGDFFTKQQIIDLCLRILAEVVGSEEDAQKQVYMIWCNMPFGFADEINDEQTLNKLKALSDVLMVLPDYAFDVKKNSLLALVISHSTHLKSYLEYYYQPSQIHTFKGSMMSMKEPLGGACDSIYSARCSGDENKDLLSVQSTAHFTLMDRSRRLDNIFSYHHLSEHDNSKWNFDHWLIVTKKPEGALEAQETLDFCVQILAEVIGSEQEAKKKIYILWCKFPFGFGAEIDEDASNKLKGCLNVLKVLPDHVFDAKDKVNTALFISTPSQPLDYYYYGVNDLKRLTKEDYFRSSEYNEGLEDDV